MQCYAAKGRIYEVGTSEYNDTHKHSQKLSSSKHADLFISTALQGGLGNQIHSLINLIITCRRTNATLLMPGTPKRFPKIDRDYYNSPVRNSSDYWNTQKLSEIISVTAKMPHSCNNRFNHFYFLRKQMQSAPVSVSNVSIYSKNEVCFLSRLYLKHNFSISCSSDALRSSNFAYKVLHQDRKSDSSFINELQGLKHKHDNANDNSQTTPAICIFIDGMGYNWKQKKSNEYFFSFMHYLESSTKIRTLVKNYITRHNTDMHRVAVWHLRYDEHLCFENGATRYSQDFVCLRKRLSIDTGTIFWAPVRDVVMSLNKILQKNFVTQLYIAFSPYVPKQLKMQLVQNLKPITGLLPLMEGMASNHEELNFMERELAINANTFIGDVASTWSTTIYYKRRTLGKMSSWCAGLCRINQTIMSAKYLPLPQKLQIPFDNDKTINIP